MINTDILSLQPKQNLQTNSNGNQRMEARQAELKKACKDFETTLTTMMLKEGMKSAKSMGNEEMDSGSSTYMDMANEQMASFISQESSMGLADMLYAQVKTRL